MFSHYATRRAATPRQAIIFSDIARMGAAGRGEYL
jgi:hypothetical protein